MLKIGMVSPFLPEKDGIAIYSNNILLGLGKNRKNIITIGRQGSKADYIIDFKSFSLKNELERIIQKEKLSCIHIQYVASFFSKYFLNSNLIAALRLSVPTIVTLHEVHYSIKEVRDKILSYIEKKIIEEADRIIVHTSKQKEFLEERYKTDKIVMIYHGLNLYKIPKREDRKNILCFGMISHGKGIPYLIDAMRYLPEYNLTIAGKFVNKKSEKEVVNALKKSNSKIRTDFGWIDENKKWEYYKQANIVVLPHIWAPYQSGILHNAIAYGLPVVVTKVGAIHEMVELFKFGEIVKPRNPKAIAEGIRKVFKEYNNYEEGISKYRKVANWDVIAKQHFKEYKNEVFKKS